MYGDSIIQGGRKKIECMDLEISYLIMYDIKNDYSNAMIIDLICSFIVYCVSFVVINLRLHICHHCVHIINEVETANVN